MDQRATMSQRARTRTQACDQDDWINGEIKTGEVLIKVVKDAVEFGEICIKTVKFAFKTCEYGINGINVIKDDEDAVKFGEVCIKEMVEYVFE